MILKPGKEHGQMHRKLSLGMEKVGIEDIQISHEVGSDCCTEEHGQQDGHKDKAQSTEEVEPGRRLNQHHPCSGIRHQKEVGLRVTWTGVGTRMVEGWTMRFFFLAPSDTNLMTVSVVSHHPTGAACHQWKVRPSTTLTIRDPA